METIRFKILEIISGKTTRLSRHLLLLLMVLMAGAQMKGQIVGDSAVIVCNNWLKGDSAVYEKVTQDIKIQNGDTVRSETLTFRKRILLKDIRPDGDLLFEVMTTCEDVDFNNTPQILNDLHHNLQALNKIPQVFLTDSLGNVKDLCNYDELRAEADSCVSGIIEWMRNQPMPEEILSTLINGVENSIEEALSKETLISEAGLFNLYGNEYEIGYSSQKIMMPIPMFDNREIDATLDFVGQILEKTEEREIVLLRTEVIYDSDQLMSAIWGSILPEVPGFMPDNDPERPKISITRSDEYVIEVTSGTILKITTLTTTAYPNRIDISYESTELVG